MATAQAKSCWRTWIILSRNVLTALGAVMDCTADVGLLRGRVLVVVVGTRGGGSMPQLRTLLVHLSPRFVRSSSSGCLEPYQAFPGTPHNPPEGYGWLRHLRNEAGLHNWNFHLGPTEVWYLQWEGSTENFGGLAFNSIREEISELLWFLLGVLGPSQRRTEYWELCANLGGF